MISATDLADELLGIGGGGGSGGGGGGGGRGAPTGQNIGAGGIATSGHC